MVIQVVGLILVIAGLYRWRTGMFVRVNRELEAKVREHLPNYRRGMVVTDGVFSMDGDIAPLDKLYEIAQEYDVITMVDDAHGEGVLGKGGRGIVDHFGLHGQVDIEVGTMSKAFGVVGGVVAEVDPDKCAVCVTCVRTCPYNIPYIGEEGHAVIEPAHPRGMKLTRPLRETLKLSREFVRNTFGY